MAMNGRPRSAATGYAEGNASMQPAPGILINPRVRLIRALDEGAMGTVWVAEHLTLHTEVAVKFVSDELLEHEDVLERFQREARAAAQIKSPNVVQMLDHGVTEDGVPYIVMELLDGQSLADLLDLQDQLGLYETGIIVTQVARALAKAHALGIIHRDIKPENIFLLEENEETSGMEEQQVKVLDFGIAKHIEIPESLTVPGMVIGTPGYMCPDQILDSKEVDQAADLWSLAVVAYVCLTGDLPFYGETMAQLVGAHVKGQFTPVTAIRSDVPDSIDAFFAKAFDKKREQRFQTAVELATAFREICGLPSGRGTVPPDELSFGAPRKRMLSHEEIRASRPSLGDVRAPFSSDADDVTASPVLTVPKRSRKVTGLAVASVGLVAGIAIALTVDSFSSPTDAAGHAETTAAPSASAPLLPVTGPWTTIPPGKWTVGCDTASRTDCDDDTIPAREVSLEGFRIGRREVTVAEYRSCVEEEACTAAGLTDDAISCSWGAASADDTPLNCVSWKQASAYCQWAGGDLPTEVQWEVAARGADGRRYPWGDDDPLCSRAVMKDDQGAGCGRNNAWQVGSRPQGKGPHGTFDMAGNLREWTADWYAPTLGPNAPLTGPATGTDRVVRGGGFESEPAALRTYHRDHAAPDARAADLGFRCVRRLD